MREKTIKLTQIRKQRHNGRPGADDGVGGEHPLDARLGDDQHLVGGLDALVHEALRQALDDRLHLAKVEPLVVTEAILLQLSSVHATHIAMSVQCLLLRQNLSMPCETNTER